MTNICLRQKSVVGAMHMSHFPALALFKPPALEVIRSTTELDFLMDKMPILRDEMR